MLWVVFDTEIPAENVRRLMMWALDYSTEYEIFPKQDKIMRDGYGNFLRFQASTTKTGSWSGFWDAASDHTMSEWTPPDYLLWCVRHNSPSCIPLEALDYDPPKVRSP